MNRSILVWKFFFQQKWEEITDNIFATFMVSYALSAIFGIIAFSPEETKWWAAYILFIIAGIWIIAIVGFILKVIFMWLKENYERANKRADKEMKKFANGGKDE